jgi:hypothetical protein
LSFRLNSRVLSSIGEEIEIEEDNARNCV